MGHELQPLGDVPPARRIQGRHVTFDALASVCNTDVRNRRFTSQLARALKEIRAYFWEETAGLPPGVSQSEWEHALSEAIYVRANLYRERFPTCEVTPTALAKWWHQVLRPPVVRSRSMTAREFLEAEIPRPLQRLEAMFKESNRGT